MSQRSNEFKKMEFFELLRTRANCTSKKDVKSLKSDYGDLIPLFVYDDLMKGFKDDYNLQGAEFFGQATTHEDNWIMMRTSDDTLVFPQNNAALKSKYNLSTNTFRRVQGELYGVTLDTLYWLDCIFNNGHRYKRTEIPVMLHQYKNDIQRVRHAQVYFPDYGAFSGNFMMTGVMMSSPHLMEKVYHSTGVLKVHMPVVDHEAEFPFDVDPDTDAYLHNRYGICY